MKADTLLDELQLAGYTGTELGDYGFLPVAPSELKATINRRKLDMIGAFCAYALWSPEAHEKGRTYARNVAAQLSAFKDQEFPPYIVLSDSVEDENRIKFTSKITKSMGLTDDQWKVLTDEIEYLMKMIKDEFGVAVHYHPHCGSFIEAPWEIERLVKDVPDLRLIFDTAHITMGAQARPQYLVTFLNAYPQKVHSFHFKDYDSNAAGKDYFELVNNGCFPELGKGICDFEGVRDWQEHHRYKGWIVVEQDILDRGTQNPLQSAIRNLAFLHKLFKPELRASKRCLEDGVEREDGAVSKRCREDGVLGEDTRHAVSFA